MRPLSERVTHPIGGPSLTQQHQKDETDINKMSAKLMRARAAGNPTGRKPFFGVIPSETFHEMLNKVTDIDNQFRRLPGKVRFRFRNNPEMLLRFLEDSTNLDEAVKLGLVNPPPVEEVPPSPSVDHNPPLFPEAPKADPEANPAFKTAGKKP